MIAQLITGTLLMIASSLVSSFDEIKKGIYHTGRNGVCIMQFGIITCTLVSNIENGTCDVSEGDEYTFVQDGMNNIDDDTDQPFFGTTQTQLEGAFDLEGDGC